MRIGDGIVFFDCTPPIRDGGFGDLVGFRGGGRDRVNEIGDDGLLSRNESAIPNEVD